MHSPFVRLCSIHAYHPSQPSTRRPMQGMQCRCSLFARGVADAHRRHLHTVRRQARLSAFGGLHGFTISAARLEARVTMGLDIGGYDQKPDWPKMGPSLLIASCLILAIRTAKWPPRSTGGTASDRELDVELEHAIHLAGRVLSQSGQPSSDHLSA
jgi:hypothetical protein